MTVSYKQFSPIGSMVACTLIWVNLSFGQAILFNEKFPEIVGLDSRQLMMREELIRLWHDSVDELNGEELRVLGRQLSDRLFAELSPQQRIYYEQFELYSRAGSELSVGLIENELVSKSLGLTSSQLQTLSDLRKELETKIKAAQAEYDEKNKTARDQLSTEFHKILVEHQSDQFKKQLGNRFDGVDQVVDKFQVVNALSQSPGVTVETGNELLPMIFLASELGSVEPKQKKLPLLQLLSFHPVADEINLSDTQLSKIESELEKSRRLTKKLVGVPISVENGQLRSSVAEFDTLLQKALLEDESGLDDLTSLLSSEQLARLVEIYRQISVAVGSPMFVIEFHKDWPSFLSMTADQVDQLVKLKSAYVSESKKRPIEFAKKCQDFRTDSLRSAVRCLTPEQQERLKRLIGVMLPPDDLS